MTDADGLPAARLADDLAGGLDAAVTAFPDGSVDRRLGVSDADGTVESGEDFGSRVAAGRGKSFRVHHRTTDPGGQAVNAARQTAALGARTRLFGHLDADVFEMLDFETHSFGSPADVQVLEFTDTAVMLTEESAAIKRWSLSDAAARVSAFERALSSDDTLPAMNWASLPTGTASFRALAEYEPARLVVDPGDVTICDADEIAGLLDALAAQSAPVVLSLNENERRFLADSVDADPNDRVGSLRAIRDAAELGAVVEHGRDAAVAVTGDGDTVAVGNPSVAGVERYVGGGDRFTGALATALDAGWALEDALALGNVCATYYVATGATGSIGELRAHLREQY